MRHKNIFNKIVGVMLLTMLTPLNPLMLTSCSDEPDSEYFYTFTGEMMSDYLKSRPEYSEFAEIIERADMMDLLATYGQYTCFAPNNDAVDEYLKARGLSSVSELSDSVCDTIARTHLVKYMYTTADFISDRVPTQNMMHRYLSTEAGFDSDSNAVVVLESQAKINFYLKDDSVENGIMQPIDKVIEKSNKYISDLISKNPRISTFYLALIQTGVIADVQDVQDPDWETDRKNHPIYSYMSNSVEEKAIVPKTKNYGYTFFIEPNEVLESKYGIQKDDIHALYELACQIYDPVYPQDVDKEGHRYENLTDSVNPLRRFVQYHILNKAAMLTDLTPQIIEYGGSQTAIGIDEAKVNPTDWHYTLLPHTMIKVERPTVKGSKEDGERGSFINRRYDGKFSIKGAHIEQVEKDYTNDAINGHYFYVDDIVAFSEQVQKTVQGIRIRMDFNAIFPEIIGNGLRGDGDRQYAGTYYDNGEGEHGNNYYFPMGYLDGVSFNESCYFLLRRPCLYFNCYQWDEMNLKGDYDITFRLPPVPFDGDWQLRLGFTVYHDGDDDRGVAQVYVDNIPQGIPLDMRQDISSSMYLGDSFSGEDYDTWTDEQKDEQQKTLKNLGAYIYPACMWRDASGSKGYCHTQYQNMRRILCQTKLEAGKDHFLRLRKTNEGKSNDTFMLDFLELVPKSVYAGDGDQKEDDL